MSPLVLDLVQDVNITEWTQDAAHESRLADCSLDGVEARANGPFRANNPSDRAGDLTDNIVRTSDGLFACRHCMGNLLCGVKPWVYYRNRKHQNAVLYTLRQHRNLWEDALVRRPSHNLMRIPLAPCVWPNNSNCRAKEFDKVPSCSGDREQINVAGDVAKNI